MNIVLSKYRAWRGTHPNSRMVFVVGTGRSGTHWVGEILRQHPDFHVTVEKSTVFDLVRKMALDARTRSSLFPKLIRRYRFEHVRVAPRHYADKSHPNVWFVEELAKVFPHALFVGIQRSVYATVASMLKHRGVLDWHKRWKEFPVPNQFLGITKQNAAEYEAMPLAAKCALRWQVHRTRMEHLKQIMHDKLCVLSYEDLIRDTHRELRRLGGFLQLASPLPEPFVKEQSLDKWRSQLDAKDLQDIDSVVHSDSDLPST